MKDSRFSYTAVRIYSKSLIERLEGAYAEAETAFASNRSEFLVKLIELGLDDYSKGGNGRKECPIHPEIFEMLGTVDELEDLLKDYIRYCRSENEKAKETIDICEALSSATLNILIESLEGNFVDKEAADAGKYDNLPKRFRKEKNIA